MVFSKSTSIISALFVIALFSGVTFAEGMTPSSFSSANRFRKGAGQPVPPSLPAPPAMPGRPTPPIQPPPPPKPPAMSTVEHSADGTLKSDCDNPADENVIECGMEASAGDKIYGDFIDNLKQLVDRAEKSEAAMDAGDGWAKVDKFCLESMDKAMWYVNQNFDKPSFQAVEISQDEWKKYRESQMRLLRLMHNAQNDGSGFMQIINFKVAEMSRARATELSSLLIGR